MLKYEQHEKVLSGGDVYTTNNRMELLAAIRGLQALKLPCVVTITSDSKYLCDAFNKHWIHNWVKQGLSTRKNGDLWDILWGLCNIHKVEFIWVKGHAGNHYNEICDKIARKTAESL